MAIFSFFFYFHENCLINQKFPLKRNCSLHERMALNQTEPNYYFCFKKSHIFSQSKKVEICGTFLEKISWVTLPCVKNMLRFKTNIII